MSVVPPAGTHSYCTEGEYLLATPVPLYVIALARLVLHYTSHTFFLNKMFTKSATALRHSHVARFVLCCSSSPAARLLICCSRDSQHRPQPHTPRFDEASDIELAQMSEPRINLDKCQRECLHYGSSLDGEDGTGGSLARRQCGASFVFATSKYGIACVCFVPYRKPTLWLRISGITRQLLFSYAAAFHPSSPRTQRMSDSIPRHRGQVHLMLLHFITGCCIGASYRTHSWQTESRHCLFLAASSCRSCYPLRYPCPCLRYCVPFAIALPRLAPSFTDVLPYRLLLLHLNSRLHARRQYRTSVTLMMALHDVARHSVPSSIEIGTREYKNPLCRNPSGFATEVF